MATSTKIVGTATNEDYRSDDQADFTNPPNVTADDGAYASFTSDGTAGNSPLLKCTMSGGNEFAIPAGSRINGITVEYQARCTASGTAFSERNVMLVVGGDTTGLNRWTSGRNIATSDTAYTAGGATDTFGIPLTVAAVNASNFGVSLRWNRGGTAVRTIDIDYVQITVHYTEAAGDIAYDSDFAVAQVAFSLRGDTPATTTYKIKAPGFGTPKAMILLAKSNRNSHAPSTNADSMPFKRAGVASIIGVATSSTSRGFCSNQATDGATPNAGTRGAIYTAIYSNQGTGDGNLTDFSAFGSDYAELVTDDAQGATSNWTDAIAILFTGSALSVHLQLQDSMNGTINEEDVIATGFEPNLLLMFSGMESDEDIQHGVYLGAEMGVCYNPGTGNANLVKRVLHIAQRYKDVSNGEIADVECDGVVYDDRIHRNFDVAKGTTYYMDVKDFTSTGYTIVASGGNSSIDDDDGLVVLAMKIDGRDVAVGDFVTPTSTGSQSIGDAACSPDITFTPALMMLGMSKIPSSQALNTVLQDSADCELFGIASFTSHGTYAHGFCNENAVDPADCQTWLDNAIGMYDEDGTAIFDADWTAFDDGGFTATWNTTDGTARRGVFLAVGPAAPAGGAAVRRRNLMLLGVGR